MNELMRHALYLPTQSSSVARDIDYLHYTVIGAAFVVALLAFLLDRLPADPLPRTPRTVAATTPVPALDRSRARGRHARHVPRVVGRRVLAVSRAPRRSRRTRFASTSSPSNGCGSSCIPTALPPRTSCAFPSGVRSSSCMTSRDVIHSFYVPAFRLKQDVFPAATRRMWFTAIEPGTYRDPVRRVLRRGPLADARDA